MNLNIPDIIKSAVPESKGKNVRVISEHGPNYRDPGFLSDDFPRSPPKLYITAESDDFDELTIAEWRDEGFDPEYISMGEDRDKYLDKLRHLSRKNMGPCETFGIIAFGDAAGLCLQHYHVLDNNPEHKLGLLIAYYPSTIPDPQGRFPSSIRALVHLAAGEEIGIVKQTQMVGVQGKRRVVRKTVESGLGTGGSLRMAYPSYSYRAAPGFAEHDVDEYDAVAAELAWSRSLAVARRAFARDGELEVALEENVQGKFFTRSAKQTLSTFTPNRTPHVTYTPTLTGGTGIAELETFYTQFFANPPSMRLTLLSRTIGADRVVDEVHVRFKHTEEMPWILPGVPATNKRVEIVVVSIVALRGGKLFHEHVYWDQASVLLQTGLLDPGLLPDAARKADVKRLPVVGREAARRLLGGWHADEEGEADNELISGQDGSSGGEGEKTRDDRSDPKQRGNHEARREANAKQPEKSVSSAQKNGKDGA